MGVKADYEEGGGMEEEWQQQEEGGRQQQQPCVTLYRVMIIFSTS